MSFDAIADVALPSEICLQPTTLIATSSFSPVWYLHFSLIGGHKNLYMANGFELGGEVTPIEYYVDGMDGTAIIATKSNILNAKETLHISLQGSGSDLKKDIHDMWHTDAIFDLNPPTFGGNLMSITTDTIIASGINPVVPVKSTINRNILIKKSPVQQVLLQF
jgi:hypothetical protein